MKSPGRKQKSRRGTAGYGRRQKENKSRTRQCGLPRMLTHRGETKSLTDWAADIGISRERMRQRVNKCIYYTIDIAEALTTPCGGQMPSFIGIHRTGRPPLIK